MKGYTTDKNFNNGQNEATDIKKSVYFTDEVKIRIDKVSHFYCNRVKQINFGVL